METETRHLSRDVQECTEACLNCYRICVETVNHCLTRAGHHDDARHIGRMLDCAEACQTAAHMMVRNSELHARMCSVCAEFCALCADDCERYADEDPAMKRCAEACRRCATLCAAMA